MPIPIAEQLSEVNRELRMRRHAYPKFVARGSLTQREAEVQIARMEAVAHTLTELAQGEEAAVPKSGDIFEEPWPLQP